MKLYLDVPLIFRVFAHLNSAFRSYPLLHLFTQRLVFGFRSFPAGQCDSTTVLSFTHLNSAFRFFPSGHAFTQRPVAGFRSFPSGQDPGSASAKYRSTFAFVFTIT